MVPADWPFAVRTGIESVLAGWLLVVVPTLAVFASTSSMDAAAALSAGTALRAGTGLWGLGLGGVWGSASSSDGAVGLPLLGLTILQALIIRWSVRRSRLARPLSGVWTVLTAMAIGAVIVVASGPAGSRMWTAVLGLGALTALIVFGHLQHRGRGMPGVERWWARRPRWADPALALVRGTALAMAGLVAVVALVAVVMGAGRVGRLHDALSAGGITASLGLVLLQAGWVPTMLVWALSWLAGPGFTVGTGSLFSPDVVMADAVPSMPLLGLLPTAPLGTAGVYLPMVITLVAVGAAWHRRRELIELELLESLLAAVAATIIITLGCLILSLGASGPIGPGRMAEVGPYSAYLCVFIALEVGIGFIVVAVLTHPTTRRLTTRGLAATADASSASAQSMRDRLGAAAEAAQGRRDSTDEARRTRGNPDEGGGAEPAAPEERGRPAPPVGAAPQRRTRAATAPSDRDETAAVGRSAPRRESAEPATAPEPGRTPAVKRTASGRSPFAGWREQAAQTSESADSGAEGED